VSRHRFAGLSVALLLAACSAGRPSAPSGADAEQRAAEQAVAQPSAVEEQDAAQPSAPEPPAAQVAASEVAVAEQADPGPVPSGSPASGVALGEPVGAGLLTLVVGGDVHAEPPITSVLDRGDSPLAGVAAELTSADLAIVNLETAVGVLGTPADKQYTFQAPASLWPALRASGVDVVNLANNHALDFGPEALAETIAGARAAGLTVVGAGRDAGEAYAPAVARVRDASVAVVGLTRVMPVAEWAAGPRSPGLASAYDVDAAAEAVRAAARLADHVVVTIHWGAEGAACPVAHQHELAAVLTGAGADVVAGHHAHRLQGIEQRDGAVVAYGLGNLVFYAATDRTRTTGLLRIALGDATLPEAVLLPARIDAEGSPQPLTGASARAVVDEVASLTPGGGICPAA